VSAPRRLPTEGGEAVEIQRESRLETKLRAIPASPGVYLFRDAGGEVLYAGKAKSLRNRVRAYFQGARALDPRKEQMMSQVSDVEFIVTDTEGEALALENNLIKQNKPKYNILLRDDKTYPYIKLTINEAYPKALITRRVRKDGALYYGPFFPAGLARRTLRVIERHFQIRNCNIRIDGKRDRPCLQFHIHRCLGPCVDGLTSRERYRDSVDDVRLFLEGRGQDLVRRLEAKMQAAAADQQYETAAHLRDAIRTVEQVAERQKMASASSDDVDMFGLHREGSQVAVSVFHMRGGRVVNKRELFWEDQEGFEPAEFIGSLVKQYYLDAPFIPVEIHVPLSFEDSDLLAARLSERRKRKVTFKTPVRGGKKEMMELVRRNAKLIFDQRFRSLRPSPASIARELEEWLDLKRTPKRIEAFDVSNLQGSDIVASMVVWSSGSMKKSDYRRFIVRSVQGRPDDYRSMREVVERRYRRLLEQKQPLPDLVLIDGGLGQLHAAQAALDALDLVDQPLASIAKREEIIYVAGMEDEPIVLERRSPILHLIQQIRDESHRFAVAFHRRRRWKGQQRTELLDVPQIGARTAERLLEYFGSVRNVRAASREALLEVVNARQADSLRRYFENQATVRG
jgi:excinuclease ABC subunit C